jgi:hypothetical protein
LIDDDDDELAQLHAGDEPHDEIARLEAEIEHLAEVIARCRKIIFAGKLALAVGSALILAVLFGFIGSDPALIIGFAGLFGGVAGFGSTASTLKQALADMQDAEAQRSSLIGRLDLRLVGDTSRRQPVIRQ